MRRHISRSLWTCCFGPAAHAAASTRLQHAAPSDQAPSSADLAARMREEIRLPKVNQTFASTVNWEEGVQRSKSKLVRTAEEAMAAVDDKESRQRASAEWKPVVRVLPDQRLRVAVIGCVNTGKTTLHNALTCPDHGRYGRKASLAADHEALTRDALETVANLDGMVFTVIDTPGVVDGAIVDEARRSLQTADMVLFVVSAGATSITDDEYALAEMTKQAKVPCLLVVNKADLVEETDVTDVLESFRKLGLGMGVPLSAMSRIRGFDTLADALRPFYNLSIERRIRADWALEDVARQGDEEAMDEIRTRNNHDHFIRVAFIGAPNAGKSSLLNRILGYDRSRVSTNPITTRDAIETACVYRGRKLRLIDTAGLVRLKNSKQSDMLTTVRNATMKAVQYAHVVVVCMDGAFGHPTAFDMKLMHDAMNEGRAVVLCVNKWDAVLDQSATAEAIDYRLKRSITEVRQVQAVVTSAEQGLNLTLLLDQVLDVYDTWNRKLRTNELNRFWRRYEKSIVVPHHVARIGRIQQIGIRPPTFQLSLQTRDDDKRYKSLMLSSVRNSIAEEFNLNGVPLRFVQTCKGSHPDYV